MVEILAFAGFLSSVALLVKTLTALVKQARLLVIEIRRWRIIWRPRSISKRSRSKD